MHTHDRPVHEEEEEGTAHPQQSGKQGATQDGAGHDGNVAHALAQRPHAQHICNGLYDMPMLPVRGGGGEREGGRARTRRVRVGKLNGWV